MSAAGGLLRFVEASLALAYEAIKLCAEVPHRNRFTALRRRVCTAKATAKMTPVTFQYQLKGAVNFYSMRVVECC